MKKERGVLSIATSFCGQNLFFGNPLCFLTIFPYAHTARNRDKSTSEEEWKFLSAIPVGIAAAEGGFATKELRAYRKERMSHRPRNKTMKPNIGQGDNGKTHLSGRNEKVWKDNARVEAYGTSDSLNSLIGHLRAIQRHPAIDPLLETIQKDLFALQTALAYGNETGSIPAPDESRVRFLEEKLRELEDELPELKNFILPGGTEAAALCHRCRTAARELERRIISFYREEGYLTESGTEALPAHLTYVLPYANRLSDLFFAMARWINMREGKNETLWKRNA